MSKKITAEEIIEIIRHEEDSYYRGSEGYEKTFGKNSEQHLRMLNQWLALVKLSNKLGIETK